jgi:hypothetical protein
LQKTDTENRPNFNRKKSKRMSCNHTKEELTIPEAIGFWQKNKTWIWPAIAAIAGMLGTNIDRIPLPMPTDNTSVVKQLENHEVRIQALEDGISLPPQDNSKKKRKWFPRR